MILLLISLLFQNPITSYKVIDGDTVHAQVDLGWDTKRDVKLRLKDFSAPELNEVGGSEAKNKFENLLASTTDIFTIPTGEKSFDRYVARIYVGGIDVTTTLQDGQLTPNQEIQKRLDQAGVIASRRNKSITVVVAEGEYDLVFLRVPPHVSLVANQAATRSVRFRYVGNGDQTMITVAPGYGSRISGFELLDVSNPKPHVVGLSFEGSINGEAENIRIDLRGEDTCGLMVLGRESLTFQRIESRATNPIIYGWGDNIVFRDMDLGFNSNANAFPKTIVHIVGMPNQVTFDGSQSWQGGDSAIFGRVNRATSGQNLNVYNLRYEQSTKSGPAIDLQFTNKHLENLLIVGSRWTDRDEGANIKGVLETTRIGSRLPGTWTEMK